jgi:hypothetical protein
MFRDCVGPKLGNLVIAGPAQSERPSSRLGSSLARHASAGQPLLSPAFCCGLRRLCIKHCIAGCLAERRASPKRAPC